MRKLLTIALTVLLTSPIHAQEKKTYEVDFKDPRSVVNALFYAAQYNDFSILAGLCDPLKENDGDTRRICSLAPFASSNHSSITKTNETENVKAFLDAFKTGKISGEITIRKLEQGEAASVPVLLHLPNREVKNGSNETIILVKRYGNWYLAGM